MEGRIPVSRNAKATRQHTQTKTGYPRQVLRFSSESNTLHPTQKPIELLEYLIKTYTNEGELVLDNCMGSGSTGVSCINTNRNFIGIELDENYFNIAKDRINAAKENL
jgi:site-specific DNA-methyltransferase (adenine-specific)